MSSKISSFAAQGTGAQNVYERICFSRKRYENNFLNENGHHRTAKESDLWSAECPHLMPYW